jgi:hypothetical protein
MQLSRYFDAESTARTTDDVDVVGGCRSVSWHRSSLRFKLMVMNLRVTVIAEGDGTVLRVDGRLLGNGVAELIRVSVRDAQPLTLDLSGLLFADADGVTALKELRARGARLRNVPPYVSLLLAMEAKPHDVAPTPAWRRTNDDRETHQLKRK